MFLIARAASISIIVLSVAACSAVQIGQDFDMHSVDTRIERGITTQSQIRDRFGAPVSTGGSLDTGGERFDEWVYYFAAGKLLDLSGMRVKMLQIKFDKQGVVRGYNWSISGQ